MKSYIEEFQGEQDKESDIIVTVDGPSASGKGTLAEHIAKVLGIKHFSASDVFYSIAEKRGIEDHELSEEAEKEVDLAVDRKTLTRGLKNSCVIDGRITGYVLGEYSDLRIYLSAEPEERARRLAKRENHDRKEAERIVEKRDREDSRRYQNYYGVDPSDTSIHDVVIDNTDLGMDEQAELMDQVLKQRFPQRFE